MQSGVGEALPRRDAIVRALASFGHYYWSAEELAGSPGRLRALAEGRWQDALAYFLEGFAYARAGASPHFAPAAARVVRSYPRHRPSRAFPGQVWHQFLADLRAPPSGRGANPKVNPLCPDDGRAITQLIADLRDDDFNLIRYATRMLKDGHAAAVTNELLGVRGLGRKVVAFFLRDVSVAFGLNEEQIGAARYLQPIDTWTRRGARCLASLMGGPAPENDDQAADLLTDAARCAGVGAGDLNVGTWVFGALFARREDVMSRALADPDGLGSFLREQLRRREAELAAIRQALDLVGPRAASGDAGSGAGTHRQPSSSTSSSKRSSPSSS